MSRQTEKSTARWYNTEGPEGVKWELGLAFCCPGKMGFRALGKGKKCQNGNGINILKPFNRDQNGI